MKIAIIGSRGIPASYGGFETFAEELSLRLQKKGEEVSVVCQAAMNELSEYNGVALHYARFSKEQNPVQYYRDSLRIASGYADVILVCGVGGSIFYPLAGGRKPVIITHVDGREELRGKYSFLKKAYVRAAQWFAARFSGHLIADSFAVMEYWKKKYRVAEQKITTIEFGGDHLVPESGSQFQKFGLETGGYYLVVCRMVPENNVDVILAGFTASGSTRKLVFVGEPSGSYGKDLLRHASSQIIFLRGVYDKAALISLRKNCFAYIHGHSVGGTNPSLLESMAVGNICICHDNVYNRETTEGRLLYFTDSSSLAQRVCEAGMMSDTDRSSLSAAAKDRVAGYYNWDRITDLYFSLFNQLKTNG
jgi:glycosyltransferase involved in cell wall biosynthesis